MNDAHSEGIGSMLESLLVAVRGLEARVEALATDQRQLASEQRALANFVMGLCAPPAGEQETP